MQCCSQRCFGVRPGAAFMCQTCRRMCLHIHRRQEHGIFHIGSGLQTREEIGLVNEIGCGLWVKDVGGMSLIEILFKRNGGKVVCDKPE